MNVLSMKEKVSILKALFEGNSIRSVERMTGHHRDTVMRVMLDASSKTRKVMNMLIRNVKLNSIQVDELWTFVGKKDKKLSPEERAYEDLGSQYIFVAIDADTELIPCFAVGERDSTRAMLLMWDLQSRIKGSPDLTTDGFDAYPNAVARSFRYEIDYAQLVKVYTSNGDPKREGYSPIDFASTKNTVVSGHPKRSRISTSYVERQNLTMRMSLRRLTRLTN